MRSRLERLLAMEQEIRRGRYPNVERLCELFEVQPRTVFADIRELRKKMGMQIRFDRNRNGYYNACPDKQLPTFDLTDREIFGLALGAHLLGQVGGTSFEAPLRSALDKIYKRSALPETAVPESISRIVLIHNAGPITNAGLGVLIGIFWACIRFARLSVSTHPGNGAAEASVTVDPYRLVCHAGSWYVAGFCHSRQSLRLFSVSDIADYRVLKETYEPLTDREVDEWLDTRLNPGGTA